MRDCISQREVTDMVFCQWRPLLKLIFCCNGVEWSINIQRFVGKQTRVLILRQSKLNPYSIHMYMKYNKGKLIAYYCHFLVKIQVPLDAWFRMQTNISDIFCSTSNCFKETRLYDRFVVFVKTVQLYT